MAIDSKTPNDEGWTQVVKKGAKGKVKISVSNAARASFKSHMKSLVHGILNQNKKGKSIMDKPMKVNIWMERKKPKPTKVVSLVFCSVREGGVVKGGRIMNAKPAMEGKLSNSFLPKQTKKRQ